MTSHSLLSLFQFDALAVSITALVGFIGLVVGVFASRYLAGDSQYSRFFGLLALLVASVMTMAAADHLILFLFAWGISNFTLVRLMIHKPQWVAAANSGWLAARTFIIGYLCLTAAFALLYLSSGLTSIHAILNSVDASQPLTALAALLMIVTAMTQSAIWPFHRWLISSLNAPTPVSAIMHAGLVNGGGVLIVKFAPLYLSQTTLLTFIFIAGLATTIIGSIWKLMQSDIKRMLACSTVAQMGFMFIQCGLGLFAAAIAHLCWHGMFKANLFLNAGSAAQQNRLITHHQQTVTSFSIAMLVGIYGSYIFAQTSHQAWLSHDTSAFLIVMVLLTTAQFALNFLGDQTPKKIILSALLATLFCAAYGYSIYVIEKILSPLNLMQPQPLNIFHYIGLTILCLMWIAATFQSWLFARQHFSKMKSYLYVKLLNASQPHPSTITSSRHHYRYQ